MPRYLLGGRLGALAARSSVFEDVLWRTEGAMTGALWKLASTMSPQRASDLGAAIFGRLGPRMRKHRHVLANLAVVLPGRTPGELEPVALQVWQNFGRVMLEFPHLGRYSGPQWRDWIDVVDHGGLAWVKRSSRAALYTTPHLANWNLSITAAAQAGIPLTVLYSKQTNPHVEATMDRYRRAMPCNFVDATDAGKLFMDELRAGRSIGLLPDQRFDAGELLPFFGREALTPLSPIRVALALDVAVIPARVERLPEGRFRITVAEPITTDPAKGSRRSQAREVMLQMNASFEAWIREKPGEWLCAKRRWPKPGKIPTVVADDD